MVKQEELSRQKRTVLLVCEIGVRILKPYYTPESLLQYEGSIFSRHKFPKMEQTRNRFVGDDYRINELGYRGSSFSADKPDNSIRIVILGGSTVFDENADMGEDWPHLVERYLKKKGYTTVEVINAGTPGHASFDSLGKLYSEIHLFEPDYVLVYNAWNDHKYLRDLSPDNTLLRRFTPYSKSRDPIRNYQNAFDRSLGKSQLYVKLRQRYIVWRTNQGVEGPIRQSREASAFDSYGIRQYALNIQLIVDTARNIGAIPILLTQARLLTPSNTEEERSLIEDDSNRLSHESLLIAFNAMDDTIKNVAKEKQVDFLDLSQKFSGKPDLFIDTAHTTKKGSQELAKAVTELMSEVLDSRSKELARALDQTILD